MPFDPNAYLNEEASKPVSAEEVSSDDGIPAQVQPKSEGFDPDQFLEKENQEQYGTSGQQAKTFGEAVARGFVSQPVATVAEKVAGVPGEDILGREKANPWTNFFGELTGFGAGMLTGTGEAALLSKIGGGATSLLNTGKIGSAVVKAAIDGLVLSGGDEASKSILQDPDQTVGSVVAHVGLGTVLSGALGSVLPLWSAAKSDGVNAILNLIKSDSEGVGASLAAKPGDPRVNNFMKTALSVALGPSPENIEARVANLEKIRTAPEFQDVYDHILDHLQTVGDDVAAQKEILATAQKEFEKSGYEAALASQSAKAALKDAQTQIIQDLTDNAFSKAPAMSNAIDVLNTNAINDSRAARELLNETNKQVTLKPFYEKIKELQDKVFSFGSPLALQQAEMLGKYAETVGAQYGVKADAPMVKSIIEGLDGLSKWNGAQLEGGLAPYYRQIRHVLDQTLKEEIPGYASAIKPAAEKFKLLEKLSGYSTPETAIKKISGLKTSTNFINEMPILRDLENASGIKFTHDLDGYASPALREMRISKLPEYEAAEKAAQALAYYRHPETYAALEHTIMTDPEWLAAMEAKSNVKGLTEASLQGKMNSAMQGKNINSRSLMQKLPGLNGMSIPEILDLISVRQAFVKGAGMGSRNVNLFGGVGATAGGIIGGTLGGLPSATVGGGIGGSIGGMFGSYVDKKGPALAAKLLDKYVDSFGSLPENAGLSARATRRVLQSVLGTQAKVNAEGFKAAADYSEAAAKGMAMTKKAAQNVFSQESSVIPKDQVPGKEKIEKLDSSLKDIKKNQKQMFAFGGEVGHYLPSHGQSIATAGATAVNTLNSLRPESPHNAPLDKEFKPSESAMTGYNKILEVAEQPLMLMKHLSHGTLIPQHVNTVRALYPKFLDHMNQQLMSAMTDHISEGKRVPYHIRQGLTMMMGQPMDSTMSPQNMQSVIRSALPQQAQQQQAKSKGKSSGPSSAVLSQINKVNAIYPTDLQEKQLAKTTKY